MQLVPALRPDWHEPWHLKDWCEAIESSLDGGARCMISVPFQHYKSSVTLIGIVWLLLRRPTLRIILLTHSHNKAKSMGKDLRDLWIAAGGHMRKGHNTIEEWQTTAGGGCVVMSAGQSNLGYPCDMLLVDDPLDETEYMLSDVRNKVDSTIALYTARCATHLNSVLIVASRWHPDDPIGRRIQRKEAKWTYICHAGIENFDPANYGDDLQPREGADVSAERAYAPEVMDLEAHHKMRREWLEVDPSGRGWWAQVQNQPLPDALGFFVGETPFLGAIPPATAAVIFGVDAAFTAGKKSDFFAAVGGIDLLSAIGVFHVVRHQRGLSPAIATLVGLRSMWPLARFVAYTSGPEVGVYHHIFQESGVEVEQMPARWNKATRAQKAARAWSSGKIQVLLGKPWSGTYVAEMHAFDGSETGVDDQADATVAMHDAIQVSRPIPGFGTTFTFGRALT